MGGGTYFTSITEGEDELEAELFPRKKNSATRVLATFRTTKGKIGACSNTFLFRAIQML